MGSLATLGTALNASLLLMPDCAAMLDLIGRLSEKT
jgi:hypothetical protein